MDPEFSPADTYNSRRFEEECRMDPRAVRILPKACRISIANIARRQGAVTATLGLNAHAAPSLP